MSDAYRVEVRSVDGGPTALGWSGSASLVVDRPAAAGGRGLGFNGGQLLSLAVAGCVSNDLFREAARRGIALDRVAVTADSDYAGDPAVSTAIEYTVQISGATEQAVWMSSSPTSTRSRRSPTPFAMQPRSCADSVDTSHIVTI
jgi:putative redox protein